MTELSESLLTRVYYTLKPFLPRSLRWALKRRRALGIRERSRLIWPINQSAGLPPRGWPGWPEGRKFAVVLTHDVEGQEGVDKVKALAELEMSFGFRSAFNFIPEGDYQVPAVLRDWLVERGFEVGVHDLNHDGKLYRSREEFREKAERINHYLKEWNAGGFRSGFMLRRLDWLHDLDIDYDCSTFDTDPFEPQPDGAHTIFPYWIPYPESEGHEDAMGYVELPYTLPQDSTMFLLLQEKGPRIWLEKVDWLAEQGGMVLLNVHPDYIDFDGEGGVSTFPASNYGDLLKHLRDDFGDRAWEALPRDVAKFVNAHRVSMPKEETSWPIESRSRQGGGVKVWVDLENTPHIPFFQPIIRELRKQGHQVVITARDAYQTCELAGFHGMSFQGIGHHYGRNLFAKAWGLLVRGLQLTGYARHERPDLSLNLGSRTQNLASRLLGIPVVEIMDYEHTLESPLFGSDWYLTPEVVHRSLHAGNRSGRIHSYAGLKEDVYVPDLRPDDGILDRLGLASSDLVVCVRPPATEAHYHNAESEELLIAVMEKLKGHPEIGIVILPRNRAQEQQLRSRFPEWFETPQVVIPPGVIDGLNLIWHSDLVISGGGTMNREAAALGVPVYSIFRGRMGAVDRDLRDHGRLTMLENRQDVARKLVLKPRTKLQAPDPSPRQAQLDILEHLKRIIASLKAELHPSEKLA